MNIPFSPWILVVLVALLALTAVGSRVPVVQTWQMTSLAARVGLGIPRDLDDTLRARVRRRMLAAALGGLVGLAIGVGLVTAAPAHEYLLALYTVSSLSLAGSATATVWTSFSQVFATSSGPRIARLSGATLSSYVPVAIRILAWVLVILAGATVLVAAQGRLPVALRAAGPLLGISVLGLALVEVFGRRLVARSQAAATTDELVWDDALRSSALNEIVDASRFMLYVGAVSFLTLGTWRGDYWLLIPAVPLALGFILSAAMQRQARTWYLSELWPGSRRRTPEEEEARSTSRA